ncbi:MAG: hypothetical protein AAFY20_15365 [Cyanobacteria bacterium J06639_14]
MDICVCANQVIPNPNLQCHPTREQNCGLPATRLRSGAITIVTTRKRDKVEKLKPRNPDHIVVTGEDVIQIETS